MLGMSGKFDGLSLEVGAIGHAKRYMPFQELLEWRITCVPASFSQRVTHWLVSSSQGHKTSCKIRLV